MSSDKGLKGFLFLLAVIPLFMLLLAVIDCAGKTGNREVVSVASFDATGFSVVEVSDVEARFENYRGVGSGGAGSGGLGAVIVTVGSFAELIAIAKEHNVKTLFLKVSLSSGSIFLTKDYYIFFPESTGLVHYQYKFNKECFQIESYDRNTEIVELVSYWC